MITLIMRERITVSIRERRARETTARVLLLKKRKNELWRGEGKGRTWRTSTCKDDVRSFAHFLHPLPPLLSHQSLKLWSMCYSVILIYVATLGILRDIFHIILITKSKSNVIFEYFKDFYEETSNNDSFASRRFWHSPKSLSGLFPLDLSIIRWSKSRKPHVDVHGCRQSRLFIGFVLIEFASSVRAHLQWCPLLNFNVWNEREAGNNPLSFSLFFGDGGFFLIFSYEASLGRIKILPLR